MSKKPYLFTRGWGADKLLKWEYYTDYRAKIRRGAVETNTKNVVVGNVIFRGGWSAEVYENIPI